MKKPTYAAGMVMQTVPDSPGRGRAVSLADLLALPSNARAHTVVIRELSGGQTTTRVGGSDVSATNGLPVNITTDGFVLPPVAGLQYDLGQIFVYSPPGDTLSIGILI